MERKLKDMYTEMILDTIIKGSWTESTYKDYGMIFDTINMIFTSRKITVGKYNYQFEVHTDGLFSKRVKVKIGDAGSLYASHNESMDYSIFHPMYWRINQMKSDQINSRKIAETNVYLDTYKEFKKSVTERDIKEVEQTLANLEKAEREQKEILERLRMGSVDIEQRKTQIR